MPVSSSTPFRTHFQLVANWVAFILMLGSPIIPLRIQGSGASTMSEGDERRKMTQTRPLVVCVCVCVEVKIWHCQLLQCLVLAKRARRRRGALSVVLMGHL